MAFSLILIASEFPSSSSVRAWSEPHDHEIYISSDCTIYNYSVLEKDNINYKYFPVKISLSEKDNSIPVFVALRDLEWYCNDCGEGTKVKIESEKLVTPEFCPHCMYNQE